MRANRCSTLSRTQSNQNDQRLSLHVFSSFRRMSSFQVCFNAFRVFLLLSTVTAIQDDWNRTILDDTEVRYLLQQERQRTILSEKSTCDNELCVPGKCIEVLSGATCLCPDGYVANGVKCSRSVRGGFCVGLGNASSKTTERHACVQKATFPLMGSVKKSRDGAREADKVCNQLDCKPGKCISEYGIEKCLCPPGFTAKDDKCIGKKNSISFKSIKFHFLIFHVIHMSHIFKYNSYVILYFIYRRSNYQTA
ncbi:UNVERIFIED_CONTAM: hypothetical protein NCL1_45428 [Trichonephila clavipes]